MNVLLMGAYFYIALRIGVHIKRKYSYGRIETLSGFANGIFLILISIFIVFEAIQRLCVFQLSDGPPLKSRISRLEPPEMNINQLLLVSSIGLAVNLFGMFAMGGHHHHVRTPDFGDCVTSPTNRLGIGRALPFPWSFPFSYG